MIGFFIHETVTMNEEEERDVVVKGKKNVSKITFHRSGSTLCFHD